jgi:putative membrane protein
LPVVVALALGSGWAAAQTASSSAANNSGSTSSSASPQGATSKSSGQKLSHADKAFIEDAAKGGMAEVQTGQLAAQKGSDPAVKEFGNRMVQDHGKANEELQQLAQSKGVQMPSKEKFMDRHEANKLQKLSGADFDREYSQHALKDHQKDVKKFQEAANKLKDPDVKAWAQKTLPVLQEHLAMAQKLPGVNGQQDASSGGKTNASGNTGTSGASGATGSSSSKKSSG